MSDKPVLSEVHAGRSAALPPTFVCSSTNGGLDAAWVHLAGELDIATAPQLEQALRKLQTESRLVVLDLRELAFVDSSGVHAIAEATARARQAGRRLVVLRGPSDVDRTFTLTGSFDGVEIGDLDPGAPPVQVLLQLAKEDLLEVAVTDTDAGRTIVRTTAPDISILLDEFQAASTPSWPSPDAEREGRQRRFSTTRALRALFARVGLVGGGAEVEGEMRRL